MRAGVLATLGLTTAILACRPAPSDYLSLTRERREGAVLLRLLPASGVRINARLKPALERPGEPILRFDSPKVTPDSSYFTAPAELVVVGSTAGVVRASVCPRGEEVCRMVAVRSEK